MDGDGRAAPLTMSLVISHGRKVTSVVTVSPDPGPTGPGPVDDPHQLQVAPTRWLLEFFKPAAFPEMLLRVTETESETVPVSTNTPASPIPVMALWSI